MSKNRKNSYHKHSSTLLLGLTLTLVGLSSPCLSQERLQSGLPLVEFDTKKFSGSGDCGVCHDLLYDEKGNSVSIENHWRSTMMANAAKEPFWKAKVSSETHRNPTLKNIIEEKCVTCHMPMAWIESDKTGTFSPGFNDLEDPLHEVAMDGVSCSVCHQIKADNLGMPESYSGNYIIDNTTEKPNRTVYGPSKNPEQEVMKSSVGYIPEQGGHIQSSKLCATCHTLYTPYVDAAGNVLGEFPEQTAYLEWLESSYSKEEEGIRTCQECHMPVVPGEVQIARYAPSGTPKRPDFSQHHFVGGNVQMLRLMKSHANMLNLTASGQEFEDTIGRTKYQLQNDTATIDIIETERDNDSLKAVIDIKSIVGHKLPTGIPCRRIWIHFTVTDAQGNIIFESGSPNDDGSITGNINDSDINDFHPHYDIITNQKQVQIYETILANSDGDITYTLLRAAKFVKDNRILPPGFNKDSVTADIAVQGLAANDDNFIGGSDTVTYVVPLADSDGPLTIKARLLFTALSYSFLEDLRQDDLPLVHEFFTYWKRTDKSPSLVSSASLIVD